MNLSKTVSFFEPQRIHCHWLTLLTLVTLGLLSFSLSVATAANYNWGGTTSDWTDTSASGWNGGPPTSGDTATINIGSVSLTTQTQENGVAITLGGSGVLTADAGMDYFDGYSSLSFVNGGMLTAVGGDATWGAGALNSFSVTGSSPTGAIIDGSYFNVWDGSTFSVADVTGDANPDLTISAVLSKIAFQTSCSVTKTGAGTLSLAANNYLPSLTIAGGTLFLPINNVLNNVSTNIIAGGKISQTTGSSWSQLNNLTLQGGTLESASTALSTFGCYWIPGTVTVSGGAPSYFTTVGSGEQFINLGDLGSSSGVSTFNVADVTSSAAADLIISTKLGNEPQGGSAGLVKTGAGTLELDAANTYIGGTTISNGTVSGTGTLASAVTVTSGGTLSPGTAAALGTLTINSTLSLGGNVKFRINKTGGSFNSDQIAGTSAVTAGGSLNVTLNAGSDALQLGDNFRLFNVAPTGTFAAVNLPALPSGYFWATRNNYATITVASTGVARSSSYYVAPTGSDSNPGTSANLSFKTLAQAQAVVRAANAVWSATNDITIYLAGGLYRLTNALTFTSADSGQNGNRIIWAAASGQTPVLNGGVLVTNWVLHDPVKNIWRASVPAGKSFRQLFVNGTKGNLARSTSNLGLIPTPTGYSSGNSFLQSLFGSASLSTLEVVSLPHVWDQVILPVANIDGGGNVTIQNPAWSIVTKDPNWNYDNPLYLQNAYEFLASPGDWYLRASSNLVYYIPRSGQNMATAAVEAPVLEQLVVLAGTTNQPVSNLRFERLSFQMTTWKLVGPGFGLTQLQANQPEDGTTNWNAKAAWDGAGLQNVDISQCNFSNLGGNGVNVLSGSQNVVVDHCLFQNLSASAIQIDVGWLTNGLLNTATSPNIVQNVIVANNTVHDVCTEYPSGCGIFVGYTRNCSVLNNQIYNLPYSGISLGWGWGFTVNYTSGNFIDGNLIHDCVRQLSDGGSIYCLGLQQHATLSHNYLSAQPNINGVIYLDAGSTGWSMFENVVKNNNNNAVWWYFFNGTDPNNYVYNNYSDYANWNPGVSTYQNNTIVNNGVWPVAAQAITNAAGPATNIYYTSATNSILIGGGFPAALIGWTIGGPVANQTGVTYGTYADDNTPAGTDCVAFNVGNIAPGATLSTTFKAQAGHTYALSYSQATWGGANNQSLQVDILETNNTIGLGTSTTLAGGTYSRYLKVFTARTTGTDTLLFTDQTTAGNANGSDVSLTRVELRDVSPQSAVNLTAGVQGGQFVIRWPLTGYSLYASPALGNGANWTLVTNPLPAVDPGNPAMMKFTLPVPATNNAFFRLQP